MRSRTTLNALSTCILLLFGQMPECDAQKSNSIGVSGFSVAEKENPRIGFTAVDLSARLVENNYLAIDGGFRFIGAVTGQRGGYFAFGYCTALSVYPSARFHPVFDVALLAGGGASAPDKDGWMLQSGLAGELQAGSVRLRAGINYAYVSGGAINGFSPVAGVNWNLHTPFTAAGKTVWCWDAVYGEVGYGFSDNKELGFIGAGAHWKWGHYIGGDVVIHALANTHGGYMQSLCTIGPELRVGNWRFAGSGLLGMGGGGAVKTEGGGLYGAQLGVFYQGNTFYSGLKFQHVDAFSRKFGYEALFLSAGKSLGRQSGKFTWEPVVKAYLGHGGFGNVGARFTGLERQNWRLTGATYWAFTHNKGAYAEGLFEAIIQPADLPLYVVFSGGAGAGINRKTASLIGGVSVGCAFPGKNGPFGIEVGWWQGGNIPQWSSSLSCRIGGKK